MVTKVMLIKVQKLSENFGATNAFSLNLSDYLELECLLSHFNEPYVMDIKMGTRTYLKNEVEL